MYFFNSGTIDDCELVEGLVLNQRVESSGVTRVEKAKIGLIQFCLSPPKTDVSHLRHTLPQSENLSNFTFYTDIKIQ